MNKYLILALTLILGFSTNLSASNRTVAEWEPMRGVLIRYPFGVPTDLIREMAEEDTVYILVQDASAQDLAANTLSVANVNLPHVSFITAPTNSHWTRDWGPQSVFVDDESFAILDQLFDGYPWVPGFRYNLPHDDDAAVNAILSNYFNVPLLTFPAYLTGGNFMSDGYNTAFSTAQMISESIGLLGSDQFIDLANSILGITNYHFTINPELYGIQHIDCWAKLLDAETVLVKQLPESNPEYQRAENIAQQFEITNTNFGRPYRVLRVFCDTYSDNSAAAYTNSLILNRKVYVPLFGIASDATALQTYANAMPGYEVVGFTGSWYYYDALHCRTIGIADAGMLRIDHFSPNPNTQIFDGELGIDCRVKSYANHAMLVGEPRLYFKTSNEVAWHTMSLIPTGNNHEYSAVLTDLEDGSLLQYYISASDESGRSVTQPIMAPQSFYSTLISSTVTGSSDVVAAPLAVRLYPNPASTKLQLDIESTNQSSVRLSVHNLRGQRIHSQTIQVTKGISGHELSLPVEVLSNGLYVINIEGNGFNITKKLLICH